MDAAGARELRIRLDEQDHWQRAEAVARGDQPRVDPDIADLEEIGDGIRLYRAREDHERMTKRLVDGRWQTVYEVERERAPWRSP